MSPACTAKSLPTPASPARAFKAEQAPRVRGRQWRWEQPRHALALGLGIRLRWDPERPNPLLPKATLTQAARALFTSTAQGPHDTPSQQGLDEVVATQGKAPDGNCA